MMQGNCGSVEDNIISLWAKGDIGFGMDVGLGEVER